jgi:hypothetical protein
MLMIASQMKAEIASLRPFVPAVGHEPRIL